MSTRSCWSGIRTAIGNIHVLALVLGLTCLLGVLSLCGWIRPIVPMVSAAFLVGYVAVSGYITALVYYTRRRSTRPAGDP